MESVQDAMSRAGLMIRQLQEDNAFLKAQLAGERKNIAGWIAARDAQLKRAEFAERQLDEVLNGVCEMRAALEKAQAESVQGATSALADKRFAAGCVAAFGTVMRIVGSFGTRVAQPQGDAKP